MTGTRRHHCKSTYSSDHILTGRTAIILTMDIRRHYCKVTYSSDDLLADDGLTNPRRAPVVITQSLPTLQMI